MALGKLTSLHKIAIMKELITKVVKAVLSECLVHCAMLNYC